MRTSIYASMEASYYKKPKFLFATLETGSAVAASSSTVRFTSATFYGFAAVSASAAPTNNSNAFLLGFVDVDGASGVTAGDAVLLHAVAAGSYQTLSAPPGTAYDLSDVRLLGVTGDKVLVVYEQ